MKQFVALCASLCTAAAMAQQISPAEKLLFETNHLQNVHAPATLHYAYKKEGATEAGFDDDVELDVARINPDRTAVTRTRFLSGDNTVLLQDLTAAQGNPVLLGFLERDINEMRRITGGAANYFRKRIRLALAAAQQLKPVKFAYAGKERRGREVRIQPYLDDPMHDKFPAYQYKTYVFVLSEEIPGGLYEVRSASRGKEGEGVVETLRFMGERGRK